MRSITRQKSCSDQDLYKKTCGEQDSEDGENTPDVGVRIARTYRMRLGVITFVAIGRCDDARDNLVTGSDDVLHLLVPAKDVT